MVHVIRQRLSHRRPLCSTAARSSKHVCRVATPLSAAVTAPRTDQQNGSHNGSHSTSARPESRRGRSKEQQQYQWTKQVSSKSDRAYAALACSRCGFGPCNARSSSTSLVLLQLQKVCGLLVQHMYARLAQLLVLPAWQSKLDCKGMVPASTMHSKHELCRWQVAVTQALSAAPSQYSHNKTTFDGRTFCIAAAVVSCCCRVCPGSHSASQGGSWPLRLRFQGLGQQQHTHMCAMTCMPQPLASGRHYL